MTYSFFAFEPIFVTIVSVSMIIVAEKIRRGTL
jgi:hypothetical protein